MVTMSDVEQWEVVKSLAGAMHAQFEQKTRTDGHTEFWALKDGAPEWMTDVCRASHNSARMLPDDYRYEFIVDALSAIADHDDEEDARDSLEADVYTGHLTAWLASNINRIAYCDEAAENYGGQLTEITQMISAGQESEKREVFDEVVQALREHADGLEDKADEPEEDDITTDDHRQFYQYGLLVLTVFDADDMYGALQEFMQQENFWPNVWFISDHGNAHLMEIPGEGE